MTPPLCNFDQSKALKALGFSWGCFEYYVESGVWFDVNFPENFNRTPYIPIYSRPTISDAIRWFRIEKDFYSHIVPIGKKPYKFCFSTNSILIESFDWTKYDTYDDAENALLNRLIEISGKR